MNFYSPAMAALRKGLMSESVVSARLDYSQRSSKLDRIRSGGMATSFDRKLCGGVLYDLGVYPLHFAVNLFGEPQRVSAIARWLGDVDVSDMLILTYEAFDVVITVSKAGQGYIGSEIVCDRATYTMQNVSVVLGVEKRNESGVVSIDCGIERSDAPVQNPSFLSGVQTRLIKTFTRWAQGEDSAGYLALRQESMTVQRIMDEARRQIGY
jgi:predicted dehydrogenase